MGVRGAGTRRPPGVGAFMEPDPGDLAKAGVSVSLGTSVEYVAQS